MRGIMAALLGIALLAGPARASDLPVAPPSPPVDSLHAPVVTAVFAQSFSLGTMKSNLAQIGLKDMTRDIGVGVVDQMLPISWLCYDLPKSAQRVWLSSDEASQGFVDTITVTTLSAAASSRCPALPAKYQAVVIDNGLRLGMTKAELIKQLGQPSRQIDTWVVYSAETKDRNGSASRGLAVQFVNGRAAFISATNMVND